MQFISFSYDFRNLPEFSANIYILCILVLAIMFPSLTYKGRLLWKPVIIYKYKLGGTVDAGHDPSHHTVYWGLKSYEVIPRI